MVSNKSVIIFAVLLGITIAQPAKPSFWKGTPLDSAVETMRSECSNNDEIACMKFKVMSLLDTVFKKDSYQLTENVEVARNAAPVNDVTGRSDGVDFFDRVEKYLQSHDVTFKFPIVDTAVTVLPRNLDSDSLDLNIKFSESDSSEVESRRRKSKLRRIVVPILVFIVLKAITLVPLALGVLGLKAWNALQLSFFSFVISVGLAIFQLCKKIAVDGVHPPAAISAHGWDAANYQYAARSFDNVAAIPLTQDAQNLAYNGHL